MKINWPVGLQLRAMVLSDLDSFIPDDYFKQTVECIKLDDGEVNARDWNWGFLANELGKKLLFDSNERMSARQVAASEVLGILGTLAFTQEAIDTIINLSIDAIKTGLPADCGNTSTLLSILANEKNPPLLRELIAAHNRYICYLTEQEARPLKHLILPEDAEDACSQPSGAPEKAAPPVPVVTPAAATVTRNKLRTNSLDAPIQKAIEQAGSLNTAAVFTCLKELARSGEALPFTGYFEGAALGYTTDDDTTALMTKNALDKRLAKLKKLSA